MDPYLATWTAINLGEAALVASWIALAWSRARAGRSRAKGAAADAGPFGRGRSRGPDLFLAGWLGAAALVGSGWWLGDLAAILGGGLVSDPSSGARIEALAAVALTGLVAVGPGSGARSAWSAAPLLLAIRGLPGLILGLVLSARGGLEAGARGRGWLATTTLLLAIAAGARSERLELRSALGDALDLGLDGQVVAAEWVADGAQIAAWGAAARWMMTSGSPDLRGPPALGGALSRAHVGPSNGSLVRQMGDVLRPADRRLVADEQLEREDPDRDVPIGEVHRIQDPRRPGLRPREPAPPRTR